MTEITDLTELKEGLAKANAGGQRDYYVVRALLVLLDEVYKIKEEIKNTTKPPQ